MNQKNLRLNRWAIHPAWNAGLHLVGETGALVPMWYSVACIGVDLVVAASILDDDSKHIYDKLCRSHLLKVDIAQS